MPDAALKEALGITPKSDAELIGEMAIEMAGMVGLIESLARQCNTPRSQVDEWVCRPNSLIEQARPSARRIAREQSVVYPRLEAVS